MYINIAEVSITPQTVSVGKSFLLTIEVQLSTHDRLKEYEHGTLSEFTHKELEQDLIK